MTFRILPGLLTALAAVALPQIAAAEQAEQGPQPPDPAALLWRADDGSQPARQPAGPRFNPEWLFQRLDANRDGQVTLDEIPDGASDRIKELLKRADVNRDKRVTLDELAAALKRAGQAAAAVRPERGGRRRAGPPGPEGLFQRPFAGRRGPADAMTGPTRLGGPPGVGPLRRGGPQRGRPGPQPPIERPLAGLATALSRAKVLFSLLDTNNDHMLSLEEFTAGMVYLRGTTPPRVRPVPPGPTPPNVRKPMPPQTAPGPRRGISGNPWSGWSDTDPDPRRDEAE
jgi:Ca2+-binding EF-hand superfamily protein